VEDAGARFQHQAGGTTDRDMGAHADLVDHDKSAVEHVQLAALDVEDGEAHLDGDGAQGRKEVGDQKKSSSRR